MTTRFLVSLFSIIPLAGTLVRSVPPPRKPFLANVEKHSALKDLLAARLKQSSRVFRTVNFHDAAILFEQGYRDALRAGEPQIAARFLNNVGGCRFALHQYREALQTYLDARRLAESAKDNATAAKLDFNISSLYSHLGQMDAATEAIERASARLSGADRRAQLPKLLAHLAALDAQQERMPQAFDLYRRALAEADRVADPEMYALIWNDLGYVYLEHEQLPLAEHALLEGYRARKLTHSRNIEACYRNLGMLRLAQGDLPAASVLLDRAVALSREPGGLLPSWEVHYARGAVRLRQNRLPEALDDLRIATTLARNWRRDAFPDDATRISTENYIQKVHSILVETGNRLYFATGRAAYAQETFEAAEANRASSLRAVLAEPRDWRRNLPPDYWETLQKLEIAEVELLRSSGISTQNVDDRIRQLQGALTQWESRAGSSTDMEVPDLLENAKRNLRPDAAFLAFHMGTPNSYLWAVSHDGFALYRLPASAVLEPLVADFTKAVRSGGPEAQASGARVFQALFGQLAPAFLKKPRWLLALDARLFELPFAALVEKTRPEGPVYLVERHSLQLTSGAAMLSATRMRPGLPAGEFIGVADPVYNTADARWKGSPPASFFSLFAAHAEDTSNGGDLQLSRLPGSAREVAACAAAWGGSSKPILLEGADASRAKLQSALDRHPAILHFATHVLHSRQDARPGLIILSLARNGRQEVLSPVEIATWNLNGALVSLSGCSSGSAGTLPATGLMGLTRACQAAGASAVIASRWATPDDSGAVFLSFYRYLHAAPQGGSAAALQHAQVDMLHSGTWRSNPVYWSAYFVTGNQQ